MENNKKNNSEENKEQDNNKKKHSSAASLDAIISSPTDAVHSRMHSGTWSNTGTNISYEGQTAPAGGGSVGTGQASGQDGVGATIHTSSANDQVHEHLHDDEEKEDSDKVDKS